MIKKDISLANGLTFMTRGVIYLMALAVFSVCAILLPELAREEAVGKATPPLVWPFLLGAWILSIPIYFALHQTHTLLGFVDQNKAFSPLAVKALQNIKIAAIVWSIMIALGAIIVLFVAQTANPTEDVTFIVPVGLMFTFTSWVIATFAAVLQRLLQDAIAMKTENDLTV
jgi:hypothetical protein